MSLLLLAICDKCGKKQEIVITNPDDCISDVLTDENWTSNNEDEDICLSCRPDSDFPCYKPALAV